VPVKNKLEMGGINERKETWMTVGVSMPTLSRWSFRVSVHSMWAVLSAAANFLHISHSVSQCCGSVYSIYGSGSGSSTLTIYGSGSGSRRVNNIRIRLDPDPDPTAGFYKT